MVSVLPRPSPAAAGRIPVFMRWQARDDFGWGLVGANLLQHWAIDRELEPFMAYGIGAHDLRCLDPLRAMSVWDAIEASNRLVERIGAGEDALPRHAVLIDSMGNGLRSARQEHAGRLLVGRCVFEDTRLPDAARQLAAYDSLVCISRWNADVLSAAACGREVTVTHEGVDVSLFHPGPRSGLLNPDRFYVFSGGKVEYRKAHDLVLLAFRAFAARHDDAVLVAAWHSPWPKLAAGFQGRLEVPLQLGPAGTPDLQRWVAENGIAPHQFIELPATPNALMPQVLREMDCAMQVSRGEGGTNLPAKEAMACGVPVIVADNTGVRDLVDGDNCLALRHQRPIALPDGSAEGWAESDVEEIVDALERLYTDASLRQRTGARGAAWIREHQRTWSGHAAALKAHLLQQL